MDIIPNISNKKTSFISSKNMKISKREGLILYWSEQLKIHIKNFTKSYIKPKGG